MPNCNPSSPCIDECRLENGYCTGCGRSREQIAVWGTLDEETRQEIMATLPDSNQ